MSDGYRSKVDMEAAAVKDNCDIVLPDDDDLFVALDSAQDVYVMEALLPLFKDQGYPITRVKTTRSKSGNKHAYLKAPGRLTELERLCLQAILGSDRKREALGFLRVIRGEAPVTVFFERKEST
mgnify:FL=1